jgi:hypothetical protein
VLTTLKEDLGRSTHSHFKPQISERRIPVNVANRYSVPNLPALVASRNLRIVSTSHILVWLQTTLGGVANLTNANLTKANLRGADLHEATLTRADLTKANLTRADLTGANLYEATLTKANLDGAYLSFADLTEADLTGADLTGADLDGVIGADFTGALNVPAKYLKD